MTENYRRKRDLSPEEIEQIEMEIVTECHSFVAERHNVKVSTVRGISRNKNKRTGLSWWMHGDMGDINNTLKEKVESVIKESMGKD